MTSSDTTARPPGKKTLLRRLLKLTAYLLIGGKRPRTFRETAAFLLFGCLRVLAVVYVCIFLAGCLVADFFVFPRPQPSYKADTVGYIALPLGNGQDTYATWRPNPAARKTVLYFHGNGEDIGRIRPVTDAFYKRGFSILAVEYPGYGPTKGAPSEDGCYAAAQSAYSFLRQSNIPPADIVIVGYSLGTGVAVDLAAKEPASAVVLLAPFLSTFRVVTKVKIVPFDRFDSMAKIEKIRCPLLIIHGTKDSVVPFWHGERLHELATQTPRKHFLRLDGMTHFGLLDSDMGRTRVWPTLLEFVAK